MNDCAALIERSNAQLDAMRGHAASIDASLQRLNEALRRADQRNAEQTRQIEQLQSELSRQRRHDPAGQQRLRREFFATVRRAVPASAVYEILPDRIVIATDPVFIFGKGELGGEGRDRLSQLAHRLRDLVGQLPSELSWRLLVEGHSDSRALRANPRFETNWELSAARAVSLVRFLVDLEFPDERLAAVGLSSTRLRDAGDSSAAHRRNRRIELHLVFESFPASSG